MTRFTILPALLAVAVVATGCRKKTDNAKPAEDNKKKVADAHSEGPHGGTSFDVGKHEYMAEVLVKDGVVHLYFHDHNKKEVAVQAEEKEIKITAIKHDGKSLPDLTLTAKPDEKDKGKEGSSHFQASGDAVKEIKEAHALNGAKFKATIKGKEYDITIYVKEHEHDDD